MTVSEFCKIVKPNIKLVINNNEFIVKQIIKFRFSDGDFYIKCFLDNGYVLADDLNENMFVLVKEVETTFQLPFPKNLTYKNQEYTFLYEAEAIAEKIFGENIIELGYKEKFWDFKSENNNYLSLGIDEKTGVRMDFFGEIVSEKDLNIKDI